MRFISTWASRIPDGFFVIIVLNFIVSNPDNFFFIIIWLTLFSFYLFFCCYSISGFSFAFIFKFLGWNFWDLVLFSDRYFILLFMFFHKISSFRVLFSLNYLFGTGFQGYVSAFVKVFTFFKHIASIHDLTIDFADVHFCFFTYFTFGFDFFMKGFAWLRVDEFRLALALH